MDHLVQLQINTAPINQLAHVCLNDLWVDYELRLLLLFPTSPLMIPQSYRVIHYRIMTILLTYNKRCVLEMTFKWFN